MDYTEKDWTYEDRKREIIRIMKVAYRLDGNLPPMTKHARDEIVRIMTKDLEATKKKLGVKKLGEVARYDFSSGKMEIVVL